MSLDAAAPRTLHNVSHTARYLKCFVLLHDECCTAAYALSVIDLVGLLLNNELDCDITHRVTVTSFCHQYSYYRHVGGILVAAAMQRRKLANCCVWNFTRSANNLSVRILKFPPLNLLFVHINCTSNVAA